MQHQLRLTALVVLHLYSYSNYNPWHSGTASHGVDPSAESGDALSSYIDHPKPSASDVLDVKNGLDRLCHSTVSGRAVSGAVKTCGHLGASFLSFLIT